jgi:hypothetical protein
MKRLILFLIPFLFLSASFVVASPVSAVSIGVSPSNLYPEMVQNETGVHELYFSRSTTEGVQAFEITISDSLAGILSIDEPFFEFINGEQQKRIPVLFNTQNVDVGEYSGTVTISTAQAKAVAVGVSVRHGVNVGVNLAVVEALDLEEVQFPEKNNSFAENILIRGSDVYLTDIEGRYFLFVDTEIENTSAYRLKGLPYSIKFYKMNGDGELLYKQFDKVSYEEFASGESSQISDYFIVPDDIDYGSYRIEVQTTGSVDEFEITLIDPLYYYAIGLSFFCLIIIVVFCVYFMRRIMIAKKKKRKKQKR